MKFLSVEHFESRPDMYGNSYHAFTFTNLITGQSVSATISGESNLRACLYDLMGGDWEVVRAFVDYSTTTLPIREFNRFTKGLKRADCTPRKFCEWLYDLGILPQVYEVAKFICDATGVAMEHHATDMHLPASPLFVMLDKYGSKGLRKESGYGQSVRASRFISQIDNKPWLDFTFAYTPAWEAKAAKNPNKFPA